MFVTLKIWLYRKHTIGKAYKTFEPSFPNFGIKKFLVIKTKKGNIKFLKLKTEYIQREQTLLDAQLEALQKNGYKSMAVWNKKIKLKSC